MENIKFIGRGNELKEIKSLKGNFFLVVKGRRRIGKTLLLRKAFPDAVYIFIWPDKSLDWVCQEICKENNLPEFKNLKDILEYLLDKNKTIILDEFQNFLNIDKSVYGEIQKIIDDRKVNNKFLKIAVAGSSYSLMNKVFNDSASPLYGRRTNEITLQNLPLSDLYNEMEVSIEEFIKLWSVFEGVPYYYELIDKKSSSVENIKKLVVSKSSQLKEEGKVILSVEFGKDSKTYNTIISAISEGKTKLNEIASLFGNKKNEVVKYLDILRKDFNLVRKITPITENPDKSREGRYEIIDNFLSFWFLAIDGQRSLIEQERFKEVEENFDKNFNAYLGRKFEKFIILLIKDNLLMKNKNFDRIGTQWGKFEGDKGRNSYEIDILGLNEKTKEAVFGECKWKENVDTEDVLKGLIKKAEYVSWNKDNRKDRFVIFAKSFKKKLEDYQGKKVECIDLKDIQKAIRS
jgi:hypothetical protein